MREASQNSLIEVLRTDPFIEKIAGQSFSGNLYLVGGAIRELLLDKEPQDYDLVLSDRNDIGTIEKLFGQSSFILGKKPIQAHRIVSGPSSIDITIIDNDIEEDLRRRDLTINAIAYDIKNGEVIDCLGGIEDIRQKLIRYPSRQCFLSDPLRMLKALRHFANLEGFTIDDELLNSIKELKHLIKDTAPERIKYEMDHILTAPGVAETIKLLDDTGLIFEIVPELYPLRLMDIEKGFVLETLGHMLDGFGFLHTCNKWVRLDEKDLRITAYAFLLHDLGKAHTFSYDEEKKAVHFFHHERYSQNLAAEVMERLRFSTHDIRAILAIIESHMRIFLISNNESTEKAIRRIVYKMGGLTPLLILHTLCDMYGSSGGLDNPSTAAVKTRCREVMEAYAESLKKPLPQLLSGDDLLAMGFTQGPSIGQCLKEIRDKQIAGELTTREDALTQADSFQKAVQKS